MVIAIPNNQPKNPQLISNLLIVTPMSVEKQDKVNNADSAFIFLIIQSQNQWLSRIRSLHVAWVRPVGELCVAAATAATAAGPRGETHFRKRL